jgi:hypothetical protein
VSTFRPPTASELQDAQEAGIIAADRPALLPVVEDTQEARQEPGCWALE